MRRALTCAILGGVKKKDEEKKARRRVVTHRRAAGGRGTLEIHSLGPHPLIQHFLERLGVVRILDKHIHSNRSGVLTHGTAIGILIHNVLVSRDPLYRLNEWLEPIEPAALGITGEQKLAFNDDRMARALDQLSEFGGRGVFFQLALRCIKLYGLETRRIHHDTTSISFSGQYEDSRRSPRITHGHSKAHRPDLKQLVFGLNVTADGAVPLSHGVFSGNRTDDTIHRDNFDGLRSLLERDDFIYVADSKLCTKENLEHIDSHGGRFVTILPKTRKEDTGFREKLRYKAARWRPILTVEAPQSGPAALERYSTCPGPRKTEDGFRLIWIRSSVKQQQDLDKRKKRLEKAKAELSDLADRLNKRSLKTKRQIKAAADVILDKHDCEHFLRVSLIPSVVTTYKRLKPGRPKAGDEKKRVSKTVYALQVKEDAVRLRQERNTDGVFPLVTNLTTKESKAADVLQMYRYQPHLERRFQNLKTEYAVAPVYLKKPSRVVGILHVYFLALTVAALIEREIRRRMNEEEIEALPIYPEERECTAPSCPRLLELFSQVSWYRHTSGGEAATFPVSLTGNQLEVLRLLGVPRLTYEAVGEA